MVRRCQRLWGEPLSAPAPWRGHEWAQITCVVAFPPPSPPPTRRCAQETPKIRPLGAADMQPKIISKAVRLGADSDPTSCAETRPTRCEELPPVPATFSDRLAQTRPQIQGQKASPNRGSGDSPLHVVFAAVLVGIIAQRCIEGSESDPRSGDVFQPKTWGRLWLRLAAVLHTWLVGFRHRKWGRSPPRGAQLC